MATPYGNFTTLSTGTLSTGTLFAGTIAGSGTGISNLSQNAYVPYTIPWMAMQQYGNVNVVGGTWLHGGLISPNQLSVATTLQTSSMTAITADVHYGNFGTINVTQVNSYYLSTNTFTNETNFFTTQYGISQYIVSSFMSSLYTHVLNADFLGVDNFIASTATFSSLTTGAWTVDNLQPISLSILDETSNTFTSISLSTGILYVGTSSIYSSVVKTADIVSTTSNVITKLNALSNFINPFPTLSVMSTSIGSSFTILQSTASTLSTSLGNSVTLQNIAVSNISVGLQNNIGALSNYTIANTSNLSVATSVQFITDQTANAAQFTATSNYFQTSTTNTPHRFNFKRYIQSVDNHWNQY